MSDVISTTAMSVSLTAADRCDRCNAAARVRATLSGGGELLFCRHHYNEHEARLADLGATVEMESAELV